MSDQPKRSFLPLQPASNPSGGSNSNPNTTASSQQPQSRGPLISRAHEPLPPKRKLVSVACDNCRSKRTKCDGRRPSCKACLTKGESCEYEAQAGETVSSALKRKLRELEDENTSYKELYRLLRTRLEPESAEILRRIGSSDDPREVWQYLKEAELLLANSTGSSASASASRASETTGSDSDGRSGKSM